jgi:hypothetical protein
MGLSVMHMLGLSSSAREPYEREREREKREVGEVVRDTISRVRKKETKKL